MAALDAHAHIQRREPGVGIASKRRQHEPRRQRVGAAQRLRRAAVLAVAGEVPDLIFGAPIEHPSVCHDAGVASGRQHPRRERPVREVQVRLAFQLFPSERQLEASGVHRQGLAETGPDERVFPR